MRKPYKNTPTHAQVVREIAEELGIDTLTVNRTIRAFFSFRGVKYFIKLGEDVSLRNLGTFRKSSKRRALDRRKDRVRTITERIKKNKYNHKKRSIL